MNMPKKRTTPTYVSLFSGGGVGCHAFTAEGFECIVTNETIKQRLDIQRYNNKCRHDSGYVLGDITADEVKAKVFDEIDFWKKNEGLKDVDILIATPPCQGMSVANHHKKNELKRNSLVVESIIITKKLNPRIFVFENVRAFLKTGCTDIDGVVKPIGETIESNLTNYNIHSEIINFKEYGCPSQRTRTIVIGTRKDLKDVSPLEIMLSKEKEKTLRKTIGSLKPLKVMGEIDPEDIYHSYRAYPERMTKWIENLKEGESAFNNTSPEQIPHIIKNNKIVTNQNKNGDKYKRCYWDMPMFCIHTRNDELASQMTVHPSDNRVFSIRELMKCMTIPDNFRWSGTSFNKLNNISPDEKKRFLKKQELNIRRCIGEAVPPVIFKKIACNARSALAKRYFTEPELKKIIESNQLHVYENLRAFLLKNLKNYSFENLSKISELSKIDRTEHSTYYTTNDVCFSLVGALPAFDSEKEITILEPSVGTGNFIPLLVDKYKHCKKVTLDVIDINENELEILKILLNKLSIPKNFKIRYFAADFLISGKNNNYDIVIGNPPFKKITKNKKLLEEYRLGKYNTNTNNVYSLFIEEALRRGNIVSFVVPKTMLSAPEFNRTRELMSNYNLLKLVDFGEKAFNVLVETIGFVLKKTKKHPQNLVKIESFVTGEKRTVKQSYIISDDFPYWLIYRNKFFDDVAKKMKFDVFTSFRDRQITKKISQSHGKYRILKSRNIDNNSIKNIPGYDCYVSEKELDSLAVRKYLNSKGAVLIPNLTYLPRACFMPEDSICDGSVAIARPKDDVKVTKDMLAYYSTPEFTEFYKIARNRSTRTMNIDSNSIFFFGKLVGTIRHAKNYKASHNSGNSLSVFCRL